LTHPTGYANLLLMHFVRKTLCSLGVLASVSTIMCAQNHVSCTSLLSLAIENTVISSARAIASGESIAQLGPIPIPPQPPHCVVEGKIN